MNITNISLQIYRNWFELDEYVYKINRIQHRDYF